MLGKLSWLLPIAIVLNLVRAESDSELQQIFDNDSDFMRGFETGLFLRTKGGTIGEYGCELPTEAGKGSTQAFETVKNNLNMAKGTMQLDPIIDEAFAVIVEFLDGLYQFITVLSPHGRK